MAFESSVSYSGQNIISTLGGVIRIEEGRGRMVIQDSGSLVELVNIDRTGLLFSDGTNPRIKLGSFATRVGLWISKPGINVLDMLAGS